ncbi:MAG: hypothetical protein H0T76_23035, partial [Nannocystis sp.]
FTVEQIDAAAIPELALVASADGVPWIEIAALGRSVTIRLRGAPAAVLAWSVDWAFVPPIFAATTHHLSPRRGALADVAEHCYDAAGPRSIAVQVVDTAGVVARGITSLDLP